MTLRVTVSAVLAGAAQLRLLSPPAGNMAYVLNHALKKAARLFIYCELSLCSSHIEINSEDNLNPFHSLPPPSCNRISTCTAIMHIKGTVQQDGSG
jgi:hypothetical protein